jgi:hypothetical protein
MDRMVAGLNVDHFRSLPEENDDSRCHMIRRLLAEPAFPSAKSDTPQVQTVASVLHRADSLEPGGRAPRICAIRSPAIHVDNAAGRGRLVPCLNHEVYYATFWGQCDPLGLVPDDLDVVFISAYTQCSALAYALSMAFKKQGTLTVIGRPHAQSFPADCSRSFDIVVKDCDRELIDNILHRRFAPPAIVSTGRPVKEFPSVEERMPEIRTASFHRGRPIATSIVPMLSSIRCPYYCNFCVEWNSDYVALSTDRLRADLSICGGTFRV